MPAAKHVITNDHGVHRPGIGSRGAWVYALAVAAVLWGCVPQPTSKQQTDSFIAAHTKGAIDGSPVSAKNGAVKKADQLPVRYQSPSYTLKSEARTGAGFSNADLAFPVGARIAPAGPKPLSLVMQELAKLKSMNISWANDVDKEAPVQITIMPEEDFFEAIDNVLRQVDCFHEMEGNTIVIKHKETRKFHIAMPFTASAYTTSVGGDVLGNKGSSNMTGTLNLASSDNKSDIWANIQTNLDKILEIDTIKVATGEDKAKGGGNPPGKGKAEGEAGKETSDNKANGEISGSADAAGQNKELHSRAIETYSAKGRGFYTIDRSVGLITVTAPRSYQNKIDNYLKNLEGEIYRQVSIEAKIVEVTLSSDDTTGLDWSSLLNTSIGATLDPGQLRPDSGLNNTRTTTTLNNGVTSSVSQTGPDSSMTGGVVTGPNSSITVVGPNQTASSATNTVISSGSILTQKFVTANPVNFNVLIDAMKAQGHVEVLSNPKISVMNGQPGMISVGESVTYIKKITVTQPTGSSTSAGPSYDVEPDSIMSGLGMGVIATIMDDNQIILSLTPVTSSLTEPIQYITTADGNQIGLPRVSLREMSTMVRVKDGEMLVVGGLIDTSDNYNSTAVAGLGSLPGPLGKLFKRDGTVSSKKELIILLRPRIIPM
jgi:MSHA type pilus biogenesis protein MshL